MTSIDRVLHCDPRQHAVGSVLRSHCALGPLGGCLLKMQMLMPYFTSAESISASVSEAIS